MCKQTQYLKGPQASKTFQAQCKPPKDLCLHTMAQAALAKRFFSAGRVFCCYHPRHPLFSCHTERGIFSCRRSWLCKMGLASEVRVIPIYTSAQCLLNHEPKLSCVRRASTWQCQPSSSAAGTHEQNCSLSHTHSQGGSVKPSPKFRSHHPKAVRGTIHHDDSSSMWNGAVWRIVQTGICTARWCLEFWE